MNIGKSIKINYHPTRWRCHPFIIDKFPSSRAKTGKQLKLLIAVYQAHVVKLRGWLKRNEVEKERTYELIRIQRKEIRHLHYKITDLQRQRAFRDDKIKQVKREFIEDRKVLNKKARRKPAIKRIIRRSKILKGMTRQSAFNQTISTSLTYSGTYNALFHIELSKMAVKMRIAPLSIGILWFLSGFKKASREDIMQYIDVLADMVNVHLRPLVKEELVAYDRKNNTRSYYLTLKGKDVIDRLEKKVRSILNERYKSLKEL